MNIKHILVDMDPTNDQQPALTRAISIAKRFNATIELFLVVYNSSLMVQWFYDEEQLEKVKQEYLKSKQRWLDTFVSQVVDAKVPVTADVQWHKPIYEGIIQKVKQSNIDLVIKSTHRHPAINKIFFSPNDWQLLKTCPVPLLLAKQDSSKDFANVMAAIDPCQSHGKPEGLDKIILDTTTELSQVISATPHAAHCYEPIELNLWQGVGMNYPGYGVALIEHGDYLEESRKHQNDRFDSILSNYTIADSNKHLVKGEPDKLLPEIVEDYDIDLLIMGTTYRTGLLGSTAEKILDSVHCDILAVKPEGFEHLDASTD